MNPIREREEFHFTRDQLASLLNGTIAEFEERRAVPGANDQHSRLQATGWMLHRLDGEAEKVEKGFGDAAMQCAMGQRYVAARDESGRAIASRIGPLRIRFERAPLPAR